MDHDAEVISKRGFPEIEDDNELYHYAEVVSGNWYKDGYCRRFVDYKLNESMSEHPYHDLTLSEFARLRLMQADKQDEMKAAYDSEEWKLMKKTEDAVCIKELWCSKKNEYRVVTKIKGIDI